MDPVTTGLIVGGAVQLLGGMMGSSARRKAARARARALAAQKAEFLRRSEREIGNTFLQSNVAKSALTASFAESNIDIGSKSSLLAIMENDRRVTDNVLEQRKEIAFKARQIEMGIAAERATVSQERTAGFVSALGTAANTYTDVKSHQFTRDEVKDKKK